MSNSSARPKFEFSDANGHGGSVIIIPEEYKGDLVKDPNHTYMANDWDRNHSLAYGKLSNTTSRMVN